jgi:hypothetical protein
MLISAVIYYYAGPSVASPALGSASPTVRKIAFGIALPTIVVAGVVNGSVACKYIYMRIWKGTDVIHRNGFKSIGSWVAICATLWTASFVIAEAIPNFNLLLGLVVRHTLFRSPADVANERIGRTLCLLVFIWPPGILVVVYE